MNIEMIFKLAGIGILLAALNMVLTKAGREDIALATTLCGLVIVLVIVVSEIGALFTNIRAVFGL